MTRAEERRQAWLDAQSEKINTNGMRRNQSPLSTRTAEEARQTMAAPEQEPAPRDHAPSATTGHVVYVGNVRERLERAAALKREDAPKPVPQQGAIDWAAHNERWKAITGAYPRN
jgi:hypothetical protein